MNTEMIKKVADFLQRAEKEKREVVRLTKEVYPDFSIEDAYLAQEELVRQKLAEGHKIVGPKMGLTSVMGSFDIFDSFRNDHIIEPKVGAFLRHQVQISILDIISEASPNN